jgi:hypothetical protein
MQGWIWTKVTWRSSAQHLTQRHGAAKKDLRRHTRCLRHQIEEARRRERQRTRPFGSVRVSTCLWPSRYSAGTSASCAPECWKGQLQSYIPYLREFRTTFDLGFLHRTINANSRKSTLETLKLSFGPWWSVYHYHTTTRHPSHVNMHACVYQVASSVRSVKNVFFIRPRQCRGS